MGFRLDCIRAGGALLSIARYDAAYRQLCCNSRLWWLHGHERLHVGSWRKGEATTLSSVG